MQDNFRRLATGGAAAALLTLSPLALATPADAAPNCPAYSGTASSETSVTVSPSELSPGEGFTATAEVTIDGTVPADEGTVRFKYANKTESVDVSGGTASAEFTAKRGRIQVFATYSGQCVGGSAAVGSSRGRASVVAGVEATAGGGNGNGNGGAGNWAGANRPGALAGVSAGLGSTGFDAQTELLGLLGLGLVGAGGITLVARRRSHG